MRNGERGAAAVEFAIIVPVLVALLLGIVAFGHAFFIQSILNGAARDAVRVMALEGISSAAADAAVASAAGAASGDPVIDLDPVDDIDVTPNNPTDEPNCPAGTNALVEIKYDTKLLGLGWDITLRSRGEMRCNG